MSDLEGHDEDEERGSGEMSFGDHLEELRRRLFRSILTSLIAFMVLFAFRDVVLTIVIAPYRSATQSLHISSSLSLFHPTQAFFSAMKVSLLAAIIVSAPIWIWQIWSFISVGLYRNERKWVYRFAPLMIGLFAGGVSFGYYALIPLGLRYLLSFRDPNLLQNWIGLGEYLSFFLTLTFVVGLTFQLPVILALLTRLEIVDIETLKTKRRHFILGAFIASALLTPPDAVTQVLMAMPLIVLFEFGIFLAWIGLGKDRPPIRKNVLFRRLAIAGVVAAVAFFLQDEARQAFHSRLVSWDVRRAETETGDDAIPYIRVFSRCVFLKGPVSEAYLLARSEGGEDADEAAWGETQRELWVVRDQVGVGVLDVRFRDTRITETSNSADGDARFLIQPSTQSMEVLLVREMAAKDLIDPLIVAMERSSDDEFPLLSGLLLDFMGEEKSSDRQAVTASIRKWRTEHPDWVWKRTD